MTRLTPHFTLEEFTFSQTADRYGIDNTPGQDELDNLQITARGMEVVRSILDNNIIHINSGFRCLPLNTRLGSSKNSFHCRGLAADFTSRAFNTPYHIVDTLVRSDLDFDKVIWEYGSWVHLQFQKNPLDNRREALIIDKKGVRFWK
tara:strand:+ start:5137 stop:5577 length:441 start_codon:yes stop_codon:yes gene_type:complete